MDGTLAMKRRAPGTLQGVRENPLWFEIVVSSELPEPLCIEVHCKGWCNVGGPPLLEEHSICIAEGT